MRYRHPALAGFALLYLAGPALAGPCDAYYTFDGTLADAGGNGYDGTMIGKGGTLARPEFAAGRTGQALRLGGTAAMRAFVDLHPDFCPQVTFTAWISPDGSGPRATQSIFSTGSGHGPGLRISGGTLTLNGPANGLGQSNAVRGNAGWQFVAGVYDYANRSYTLYWGKRSVTKPLPDDLREPEEAIWVGAFNDTLSSPAAGIVIDDLRIVGRALGKDELAAQQDDARAIGETEKNLAISGATPAVPGVLQQPGQPVYGNISITEPQPVEAPQDCAFPDVCMDADKAGTQEVPPPPQ